MPTALVDRPPRSRDERLMESQSGWTAGSVVIEGVLQMAKERRAFFDTAMRGMRKTFPKQMSERPTATTPTADELSLAIDTAFWASLKTFEGRYSGFRVSFAARPPSPSSWAFKHPRPLTVASLAAMAPIVGHQHGRLLVGPDTDGRLAMWGLSSVGVGGDLGLVCKGPGQISLTIEDKPVAAVVDRQLLSLKFSSDELTKLLGAAARGAGSFEPSKSLAGILTEVILALRARSAGGCLLIVDHSRPIPEGVLKISEELESPILLVPELLEWEGQLLAKGDAHFSAFEYLRKQMAGAALQLAGLATIDGAVVVGLDLRIVGFGATIVASQPSGNVALIEAFAPRETSVDLSRQGGHRHKSAIGFVSAVPGSSALVVSQDGHATFVGRRQPDDAVPTIVRGIEHLL